MKTETKTYANHAEEIQDQLLTFTRQHMRKELKELAVKGEFERMREFLGNVLPGNIDFVEMLALLEGAEIKALESVKNDIEDGL